MNQEQASTLKPRDRVVLRQHHKNWNMAADVGAQAFVGPKAMFYCDICRCYLIDVVWADKSTSHNQNNGGYHFEDFDKFADSDETVFPPVNYLQITKEIVGR